MGNKTNTKDYWNGLYQANDTGWDIGYPSPALAGYIDQLTDKNIQILIPGCGNSYEAKYLLDNGFTNITLIDIAPQLTAALKEKFSSYRPDNLQIITGDFFEHEGSYDLILEQTFLSALHPSLRSAYAEKMHSLLQPGGRLAGVLFNRQFDDSPPYGGSIEEYKNMFSEKFVMRIMVPCYNSIERRSGTEVFILLQAR